MNRYTKIAVLLAVLAAFAVAARMMMKREKESSASTDEQAPVVSAPSSPSASTEPAESKTPTAQDTLGSSTTAAPAGTLSEAAQIRRDYGSNFDTKRKIDMLERLCSIQGGVEDALEVIRVALLDPDPQVRRQALLVLKSNGLFFGLDLSSQINAGLADADSEVQEAAVALLEAVGVGRYPQIVGKLVSSSNVELMEKGMNLINVPNTSIPIGVYEEVMRVADSTNRSYVVNIVRHQLAKRGIPLLMEALKDSDVQVRGEAQNNLFFLLDQNFDTYEQAVAWWSANSGQYPDMFSDIAQAFEEPSATGTNIVVKLPEEAGEVAPQPPGSGM